MTSGVGIAARALALSVAVAPLLPPVRAACGPTGRAPATSQPAAGREAAGGAVDPVGKLVGSWRLESWTTAEGSDRCGEDGPPAGQLLYSADGHMSAQLGCPSVESEQEDGPLSAEEARRRLTRRHFSYYGRYTLDPAAGTVTHHVLGSVSAAWVGEDRVRSYTFEGEDRLVLDAGGAKLVWVRNGARRPAP